MASKKYLVFGIIGVAIIIWAVLTWFVFKTPSAGPVPLASITVSSSTPTADSTTTNNDVRTTVVETPVSHPTTVTAPSRAAQWILGQENTIAWNKAANITGGVYLVNATNGATVGWILQQTGPNETNFPWNTRDLQISRTSPTKITVPVGTYVIKVMFDSPEDPTITSAPFSIIYPNQAQIPTYAIGITNGVFSSSTLSVPAGSQIVFTNHDVAAYQILISSFSPFTINGGNTYTFDTTPLSPGPYVFYSSINPTLRMNITVQ